MNHNPDALNRFIAERALKEDVCPYDGKHFPPTFNAWLSDDLIDYGRMYCRDCRKILARDCYHSFADCEPILEKIELDGWRWKWQAGEAISDECWFVLCHRECRELKYVERASTRTDALVECVAKAYGWKEQDNG